MDEHGRTIAHGFEIFGDQERGYQARILQPLTEVELRWGALHLLHSDNLFDLLCRVKGQELLRAGIAKAAEQTRQTMEN